MSTATERLPWYRAKSYRGKLTEDHKRQLDQFRMQEKHPAATLHQLPEEVQGYINSLEFELIEIKRQNSFSSAALLSLMATATIWYYLNSESGLYETYAGIFGSIALIIFAWWRHRKVDKALVEELIHSDSYDPTAEALFVNGRSRILLLSGKKNGSKNFHS